MIEEFNFGNFWSFKEEQTLNMTAAKIKSNNSRLDVTNVIEVDEKLSLLKSKAIYGANASGKSNVIKALVAFIRIVKSSVKDEKVLSMVDPFKLSLETIDEPTFFQLVIRVDNVRYRYGFEADENSIKSEWLFFTPKKREQTLFIREGQEIVRVSEKHFEEGSKFISLLDYDDENTIFRNNSLFLTSLSSFGFGKISKKIVKAITSIMVINGLGHSGMYAAAGKALDDIDKKKFILDFLKNADTGINNLEKIQMTKEELPEDMDEDFKEEINKGNIIVSSRTLYNKAEKVTDIPFLFTSHESEGTIKMFELSPFIYSALKEGRMLVIDEFDSRFHPLLTKKIVELFNCASNQQAQLIFTTHDTNLLSAEILRRDQIDFVEKDNYGASHLYTLVEIKGVRNNASFEKDYIQGKYGAVPFLGDFTTSLHFDYAQED
ncbi:ATP/GTP-binding protein [Myroides sp. WP-1]|uniref:AAA family ATPase n=1 Tax=Myroides sp. WP-1 TaxID=2759944 RepID=UPI0015F93EFA|nr:ATP-binding protein [Myroides sp. WP-1]MBB1140750.1 ATP-binding protein [Myroides sp. WP-1]